MGVLSPQFGSLVPSSTTQTLVSNYLNFNNGGGNDFAQQYLPEIYEAEVERYGNRTLAGFLRMVGAEMPMSSDQVIWSEQNRLHISYTNVVLAAGAGINVLTITPAAGIVNVISINDTIVILDPASGAEAKALVTASNTTTGVITVTPFDNVALGATFYAGAGGATLKIFVYGSSYAKGTNLGGVAAGVGQQANNTRVSVEPQFTQYSNSPIILRSQYVVNGSDMAQIGWV